MSDGPNNRINPNEPGQGLELAESDAPTATDQVPKQTSRFETQTNSPIGGGENNLDHIQLSDLGESHLYRFRTKGDINEVKKAIEYSTRALDLTPNGHPDLPNRHSVVGWSYTERFRRVGEMNDIEEALKHFTRALDLTPDGHPYLPNRHNSLGWSYTERFRRVGEINDIEAAIEHFARALDLTPDGHPDLPERHHPLGWSHTERFRRVGDMNDIEKVVKHFTRALVLTPDGHPDLSERHFSLGWSYTERFRRTSDMNDIEQAIEHITRALDLTAGGHRQLSERHNSLGWSYTERFRHVGDMNDLEKALEHFARALDLTPDDHPNLSERYHPLWWSYIERFRCVGDMRELKKAIGHFTCALDLTPDGHPHLPERHFSLGVSYTERFQHMGEMNDLEKAIEHITRALDLTPTGHPYLPERHGSLGTSYTGRFQHLGNMNDLEKAIKHFTCAIDLTPDGHPDLPQRHMALAVTHAFRYDRLRDPSDLHHSLTSFRHASQSSTGPPRKRFQHALEWARYASKRPKLNLLEAYQSAVDLLPQFIWLGVTTAQRYTDLLATENLAINATAAAVRYGSPRLALEWLEHTRCVVWNQIAMLRSPLDQLQSSHPDLANRLQAVSIQLHDAGSDNLTPGTPAVGSADPEQVGKHRRRLAMEYSHLVTEARSLPGFEDFLQPMKADRLIGAARNGPIVAINCHTARCDALIIMPHQGNVMHLSLPNFTENKARHARSDLEASLRHMGVRQRGVKFKFLNRPVFEDRIPSVLLCLWTDIVKPVLDFLGFINNASVGDLPHITWCPTGALSFLPLHAAGDYDQPRSRVFDYAISSYTPTITALLSPTPGTPTHPVRVLAVGQASTPGHAPLPGTTVELACLKNHSQAQAEVEYSALIDDQATTTAVLDAMEQHEWVHLACHAHQNIVDPTKSGFFLHDGTLDLASISRRSFKNKGLAFLSACQTATGDEKLPDEAIHLASGMLMAGYPSVIATMWSVVDADAPVVADKVYAELMKEGKVGGGEAGKALHEAVAFLREQVGEKKFGRWVPYIHIGS